MGKNRIYIGTINANTLQFGSSFQKNNTLSRYLAPEYFMHGIVDEKTDIFAFGVLLLEIVTGRRPIDCSKQSLLQWVRTRDKNI